MPYAVAAAVIGAAGSIYGSNKSAKAAKEANAIAREQLAFSKQRYNDYQALYGDLNKQLVADAHKGVQADLGGVTNRAAADVSQRFAGAQETLDRNNARLGINPNSGRAQAAMRQVGLSEATAAAGLISNARETERKGAEQATWERRSVVGRMGVNALSGAASGVEEASRALQNSTLAVGKAQADQATAIAGGVGSVVGAVGGMKAPSGGGGGPVQPSLNTVNAMPAASSPVFSGVKLTY